MSNGHARTRFKRWLRPLLAFHCLKGDIALNMTSAEQTHSCWLITERSVLVLRQPLPNVEFSAMVVLRIFITERAKLMNDAASDMADLV